MRSDGNLLPAASPYSPFAVSRLALIPPVIFFLAATAAAQTTGSLSGVVTDTSGSRISAARIVLVETRTAATRQAITDVEGVYAAPLLAPGEYEIRVSQEGFAEKIRQGVRVSAGQAHRVDVTLEIGEQRDEVIVVADAPIVSTELGDYGGQVTDAELHQLPLNGRDLFQSSYYEPGVHLPTTALRESLTTGLGTAISINGASPYMNAFRLDGVYINEATNAVPSGVAGLTLGLESVSELHVASDPYSAEYGRAAGGVLAAVSRSGSNDFHGDAYWYFRNSALDAKNYFDSKQEDIPPLRRNQFGALLGGPIKREKAFFLLNYEGFRGRLTSTRRPVVPTLEARQGVLPDVEGGVRQVPVNPAISSYLDLYPTPNGRDFGDGTAEFVNEGTLETREDHLSAKTDLLFGAGSRLAVRYTFDDGDDARPDAVRIWSFENDSRYQFLHANLQQVHSPSTISNLRFAYSRVENAERGRVLPNVPESLSLVPGQPLGSIETTGLEGIGGFAARIVPRTFDLEDYQINGDLTHIAGRHNIRAGGGVDRLRFDQFADISAIGLFRFNSLENLLLGSPITAEAVQPGSTSARLWRYWQFHGYLQDDIRVTRRLNLGLGLRYETATTPDEAQARVATLRNPLTDSDTFVGGKLWDNPSKANFAPRASLAYDVTGAGRTVLRAGAGMFYDLLGSRELVVAGMRVPPLFQRVSVFRPGGFPDLLGAIAEAQPSSAVDGIDYDLEQPYVLRWRLGIDQALTRDLALTLEYVGSRGAHLMGKIGNMNTPLPEQLADGRLFIPAGAERINPNFGDIGMRRSQFNSFYHGLNALLLARPVGGLRYQVKYTWAKSIDEASASLFDEYAGVDLVPTVWDYRANRGPSSFDLRHLFVANFLYELPSQSGPAKHLIGGWMLSGVVTAQSGPRFAPSVGFDNARLAAARGDLGQRPDYVGSNGTDLITGDPAQWFNPTAFALPQPGFLGNLGRGTLSADGLFAIDVAVQKQVWRSERQTWTLRAEAFNLTNHPNFGVPSSLALFNSSGARVGSAGRVTNTATPSRQIQLALRWSF